MLCFHISQHIFLKTIWRGRDGKHACVPQNPAQRDKQDPQLVQHHLLGSRLKKKFCIYKIQGSGTAYTWISKHHVMDAVKSVLSFYVISVKLPQLCTYYVVLYWPSVMPLFSNWESLSLSLFWSFSQSLHLAISINSI